MASKIKGSTGGAAERPGHGQEPPFTPGAMLAMFTAINVITYYDRGVLSSVLDILQLPDQLNINTTYQGLLGNAYMLGYVAASPVFARLAHAYNPLRLMALGLGLWTVATAACGLAPGFWYLFVARAFTGVGEASFLCLAPPFIDKFAPNEKRSKWLSVFFTGIPVGIALGFGFASVWVGSKDNDTSGFGLFDKTWGWRTAFLMESMLMVPFVLVCALRKGYLRFDDEDEDTPEERRDVRESLLVDEHVIAEQDLHAVGEKRRKVIEKENDLRTELTALARNPLYVCIVLGYAAQTFVTGAFAFYGKEILVEFLHYDDGKAGILFGVTTAMMGLLGTGFGGWFVDRLRNQRPAALEAIAGDLDDLTIAAAGGDNTHASVDRNLIVVTVAVLVFSTLTWPAGVMAFILGDVHRGFFFLFLALSEFFLFASLTPTNNAIMWSVPFRLNPLALGMSVVFTHMLGDAASPVIVGVVQDRTDSWKTTMVLASSWLIWSIMFFGFAVYFAKQRAADHGVRVARGELHMFADGERSPTSGRRSETPDAPLLSS